MEFEVEFQSGFTNGFAGVDLPRRIRRSRSTGEERIYWSGFAGVDLPGVNSQVRTRRGGFAGVDLPE